MDKDTWKLIITYLSDETDEAATAALNAWLSKDPLNQQQFEQARWIWQGTSVVPEEEEWKESFQKLRPLLESTPDLQVVADNRSSHKKADYRRWTAVAAAITGIAFLLALYWPQLSRYAAPTPSSAENTAWIYKTAAMGKVLNVTLPDSSEIWLNSGSSISFSGNIKQSAIRLIRLKGEAFFKVKQDPNRPFIVQAGTLQTKVLGTSFNINAWPERHSEVIVMTGKVAVSRITKGIQSTVVYLLPNQKTVDQDGQQSLAVENIAEVNKANSWIDGKMSFNQLPIQSIFKVIERKYNVSIKSAQDFEGCKLTANFRNISLVEVMQTLKATLAITYTIKGQTVYIKGGKCN